MSCIPNIVHCNEWNVTVTVCGMFWRMHMVQHTPFDMLFPLCMRMANYFSAIKIYDPKRWLAGNEKSESTHRFHWTNGWQNFIWVAT